MGIDKMEITIIELKSKNERACRNRYSSRDTRVHAHEYTQSAFQCLKQLDSYWYLEEEHRRTINLGDRRLQGRFRGRTRGDGDRGGTSLIRVQDASAFKVVALARYSAAKSRDA